jgi:hypothetical protein
MAEACCEAVMRAAHLRGDPSPRSSRAAARVGVARSFGCPLG